MALKKEAIAKIASLLKLKEADLETAIKDEKEVDIAIDDKLQTFSEDEVTQLKNNEYAKGKTTGVEMAVKELKDELKLDFTGKTIKGLLEASNKKALEDAKIEPDKKVKELQDKLTTVQTTASELQTKLQQKDQEIAAIRDTSEVATYIPALGDNGPALGSSEVIQLMKANGYDFKRNDAGKLTAWKDGKEMQDKLSNPQPVKDVITGFMKEKKLITDEGGGGAAGGRGGGKDKLPAGTYAKFSELKKAWEDSGKSTYGEEFQAEIKRVQEANKEFDMTA